MKLLLLLFGACFASSIYGQKLHEHMTKEEIELVFKVNPDEVHKLEYEVVPIFHTSKQVLEKANPTIHLKAFNKNYSLYLEQNEHILLGSNTPVYLAKGSNARSSGNNPNIVYSRMQYPFPENFKLYHDLENKAAVTLHTDGDDNVHVHGTVGDDVIIQSLPLRVHKEVLSKPNLRAKFFNQHPDSDFSFIDEDNFDFGTGSSSSSTYQTTHHVIMRPSQQGYSPFPNFNNDNKGKIISQKYFSNQPSNDLGDSFKIWGNIFNRPNKKPSVQQPTATKKPFNWNPLNYFSSSESPFSWWSNSKEPSTEEPHISDPVTSAPGDEGSEEQSDDIDYPELLIVVDYETYTAHGSNINEVAKYVAAFWNAVDLRFRELNAPKIRLNIAGLIIPEQPSGTVYMDRHRVGSKTVLADNTLRTVGAYFATEKAFPTNKYDILVAMSHRNLGDIASSGQLQDGITGIATFEGVCLTSEGNSVVLVRDKGGFNGITTAAHELAHSLGAPHDGNESAGVEGGPCSWDDGYLMSYERKDIKGMHWSRCTKTALHKFLATSQAKCLKNKPDVGTPYPKILPGRLISRDEQCQKTMGYQSYKGYESNCALLYCAQYMGSQVMVRTEYRPPAEGSYCGEGKICLDAECVDDPEL